MPLPLILRIYRSTYDKHFRSFPTIHTWLQRLTCTSAQIRSRPQLRGNTLPLIMEPIPSTLGKLKILSVIAKFAFSLM